MKHLRSFGVALLWLAFAYPAVGKLTPEQIQALPPPASRPIKFSQDIQPIIEASCIKCHARGRDKGGFQLDTRETVLKGGDSGPAAVVGKSEESLLIELVAGVDPSNVMPKKGSRLTSTQIGLLRAWIDQGLVWDTTINFARPAPLNLVPHSPDVAIDASSSVNPIDQILKPYFKTHGITAPASVDDRTFARRASLDTIGLTLSAEELGRFLADTKPGKRQTLVNRLLADNQRYAEHWLSFWNDLLRNDYRGTGYIDGGRKPITGWLFKALQQNLPYDQFVAELINPNSESDGFTKGIVWRGAINSSQTPQMQAAQNISQVFMGVNIKCASCHDSLINDWRLTDCYGLASVYSDKPLEMFQCDKPTGRIAPAGFIYPQLGVLDPNLDKPARLQRLAELITGPQDGRLTRTIVNRLWAQFMGRGLVDPLDDMEQPAWNPDLLDWLAQDLVTNHYNLKRTMEIILTSQAYQMPAVASGETKEKDYAFYGPVVRRLSAEQFRDAIGQLTGVWYEKAEYPAATNQVRASLVAADPLAVALGRPNREQVTTSRAGTATTLQALELTNGQTLARILAQGAENLMGSNASAVNLVEKVYGTAFGRKPTETEQKLAVEMVGDPVRKEGVEDLLWAMSMLPEFQLVY